MKSNKPGNQNVIFLHFEKVVFAVLILGAVFYSYSGAKVPRIPWTPEELTKDSTAAENTIVQSTVGPAELELKVQPYDIRALTSKFAIRPEPYLTFNKWEPPVFPERGKRGAPKVFALEKPRAVAGIGAIQQKPPGANSVFGQGGTAGGGMGMPGGMSGGMSGPGGMGMSGSSSAGGYGGGYDPANVKAERWVVVTGLIPYETQLENFTETYSNAMISSPYDFPTYVFFEIYRSELGKTDASGQPVWEKIDVTQQMYEHQGNWPTNALDPVDLQFKLPQVSLRVPPMAGDLPPLVNRPFGREVAYPPYIPMMADSLRSQMYENQIRQQKFLESIRPITEEELLHGEQSPFRMGVGMSGNNPGSSGSMGGSMMGGGGSMGGPGGGMGGNGIGGGMLAAAGGSGMGGGGMMGGSSGMGGGGMMGGSGGMMGGMNPGAAWYQVSDQTLPTVYQKVTYCLFRYFDFDVEPGKSYQYKVRLALWNPNYRMNEKYLESEDLKKESILLTEFSETTNPVAVLSSSRILLKQVNPPVARRPWEGQTVNVTSVAFDMDDKAEYVGTGETGVLGRVLNFLKKTGAKAQTSSTMATGMGSMGSGGGMMGPPGMGGGQTPRGGAGNVARVESKTMDHVSGDCVLDVYGENPLYGTSAEQTIPGQVIMMAYDGTIKIQNVDDDKQELSRYEAKPTTSGYGGPGGM
ncbi:MAG: hypothetical protein FWC50_15265 [Planctomycetaceae bacterium]|nr:hypothetical protein [Planctomycetaceae bacterium]